MSASQISVEYETCVNTPQPLPTGIVVQFTLSGGTVSNPPALQGFAAPDLLVTEHTGGGWTVMDKATGASDYNLNGGSAGYILYNLYSPSVSTSTNTLTATLVQPPTPPPNNTTNISLINLNPALLVANW